MEGLFAIDFYVDLSFSKYCRSELNLYKKKIIIEMVLSTKTKGSLFDVFSNFISCISVSFSLMNSQKALYFPRGSLILYFCVLVSPKKISAYHFLFI